MIFRRKPIEVDLTSDAYARWLRAQRPPIEWFLRQSEEDQESMAGLGDVYVQGIAVAIGQAVEDPGLAELSVAATHGDAEAESSLATRLAEKMAGNLERKSSATGSFAGIGSRKSVQDLSRTRRKPMPNIFGAEPSTSGGR